MGWAKAGISLGLLLTPIGCGLTRSAQDVRALPTKAASFSIAAPCSAEAAQAAVPEAVKQLRLDVDEPSKAVGDPWIIDGGMRLVDVRLWYRVDIQAANGGSLIRVFSKPHTWAFTETHETESKPASLAMRIVAACTAAGPASAKAPAPSWTRWATFRDPGARLAAALSAKAPQPISRAQAPAESLADARVLGERVLLDYRSESGGDNTLSSLPTCGPLELRDVARDEKVWSVERTGPCQDEILAVQGGMVLMRGVEEANKEQRPRLSALRLESGAVAAKAVLEKDALIVPIEGGFVVVEGKPGSLRATLLDEKLAQKWQLSIDEPSAVTRVAPVGKSILIFGSQVTAIDRASGKKLGGASLGDNVAAVDVRAAGDAAYAVLVPFPKGAQIFAKVTASGSVAWKVDKLFSVLDAVTAQGVIVVGRDDVRLLRAENGEAAWTGKLPAEPTGPGLLVAQGKTSLLLIPHRAGVTAFDAATGAQRFSVSPFGADDSAPGPKRDLWPAGEGRSHTSDRLWLAGEGLVVLDAARGIAGLDLGNEGRPRYALPVRSIPHAQRRARLHAAFGEDDRWGSFVALQVRAQKAMEAGGSAAGGRSPGFSSVLTSLAPSSQGSASLGMSLGTAQMSVAFAEYSMAAAAVGYAALEASIKARVAQQADVANRQSRLDAESPFIARPISWATGHGALLVRKTDGAFVELVTGPADVYEDRYRQASVTAVVPAAKAVLTFAEGLDPSKWQDAPTRMPVKLVGRSLLGYALFDAALHPAKDYEQRSVVPTVNFVDVTRPPNGPLQ